MPKESELFEEAVAGFLQSLDKNARVTHNISIPDKDTGEPRQRDVWIETSICQLFPINIYVSCKFKKRKLSQQDMDAVIGELRSSNANKGVIFSKAGFTSPAILKAKKNDISCCKLYDDQPPDLPEVLILRQYCLKPTLHFAIVSISMENKVKTYEELFNIDVEDISGKTGRLIDQIQFNFLELEKFALREENLEKRFPKDWETNLVFKLGNIDNINIKIGLIWNIFEARLEAFLTSGSYSFTEGAFVGNQIGPSMDVRGADIGDGWKLLQKRPSDSGNKLIVIFQGGDFKKALIDSFEGKDLY